MQNPSSINRAHALINLADAGVVTFLNASLNLDQRARALNVISALVASTLAIAPEVSSHDKEGIADSLLSLVERIVPASAPLASSVDASMSFDVLWSHIGMLRNVLNVVDQILYSNLLSAAQMEETADILEEMVKPVVQFARTLIKPQDNGLECVPHRALRTACEALSIAAQASSLIMEKRREAYNMRGDE